ncbi:pilus assembly protein [Variovorax sp. DT-64]|uniref:pilus assembly protein n=1 Tax=Variovorax sp. DT-64 TaxID=3396160 RepID=UPI003F1DAD13
MKKNFLKPLWAAALLVLQLATPARAEDIDLFTGYTPVVTDLPNVIFVLDNTANWSQPFEAEMTALATAFESLKPDRFRVGLMMFSETGNGNSNVDGAYVRAAVRTLDNGTKVKYGALFRADSPGRLDKLGDKSNGGKVGKTMVEIHRYLTGGAPMAGNNKLKTDYTGNITGTAASKAIYALPGNALSAFDGTAYNSPNTAHCTGTYVIYISNGAPQDNTSDTKTAADALQAVGGSTTTIPLTPSGSQDNMADEWAKFLNTSLGVKVYTIEAAAASGGQGPGWTALLKSMAGQSKGEYYDLRAKPDLGAALGDALNDIFSKIQSVNSVFSSVSLPVSVNTQGTYLNQVFVGMFRPDQDALPRWNGNLKQYKLGLDGNKQLILQDADDANAINAETGFIAPCARSFWTPARSDTDKYWSFRPAGDCIGKEVADSPDGNIVEKGAQGYLLRHMTVPARNVKTCAPGACTSLIDFSAGNVKRADVGVSTDADRDTLVNWVRGEDNKGDERLDSSGNPLKDAKGNPLTYPDMRPSVHGDVVHSRPVAINYGTDSAPQVVVFYGGNDGALRAVNGNRSTTSALLGSAPAGSELWSFIPPEFYGSLKRLRDNTVRINYPQTTATTTGAAAPKPYGMDGPVSAYRQGSDTWLFASMRRGGRALYAFDVSNPTAPTLKWRKGCPNQDNDTGCDIGFEGIGQTWSAPKVVKASGYSSGPLLIFGGGYDKCEDVDTNVSTKACSSSTKGNKVYVLDASSGIVLSTFTTARAVSGEVTIVNDAAGLAKYAYAADLGGNVYRIKIEDRAPGTWEMTTLASLGCDDAVSCTPNRKFMFGPDVVEDNGLYVLLLGSGDREKPLRYYEYALSVANRFYMLVDKPADTSWLDAEASRCGSVKVLCHQSLVAITGTSTPTGTDLAAKKGWYLALAAGEQVVTSSVTAYGTTTFSTHIPSNPLNQSQTCRADLGTASVYNVSYLDASPAQGGTRSDVVVGGGLAPSPFVGRVRDDNNGVRDVVIGGSRDSVLSPKETFGKAAFRQPKGRVYWFIQK